MGLGFDFGKDFGSFAVVISAGFVIHRMWTKPLTTFDKVFITIGLLGFVAFLPAGLGMIFPTQMRDYYESKHQHHQSISGNLHTTSKIYHRLFSLDQGVLFYHIKNSTNHPKERHEQKQKKC